jgi:PAS domain-containing protein
MISADFIETALTAVLADIPDPVSVISKDFHILLANNTILTYLAIGFDRIRGRLSPQVLFGKQRRCPDCPIRMVFDSGRAAVLEKCFADRNGSVNWREVWAYPVRDATGAIVAAKASRLRLV